MFLAMPSLNPFRLLIFTGLILLSGIFTTAAISAAPNTYVHASDGSCLGNSPCYDNLSSAVQNVDNGGTVTVLSDVTGALTSAFSKQYITIQGSPATVVHNNQILINEFVTGWTIRDIIFTAPITIRDVVGSLTFQNMTANTINVGDFTVDTTATLTFSNVTTTVSGVVIGGAVGSSISGSILIENSDITGANVKVRTGSGPATNLNADVTFRNSIMHGGARIQIDGQDVGGLGSLIGDVYFEDLTCDVPQARIGIITFGDVTGDLAGDITLKDLDCYWLAVLTTGGTAGSIGKLTMTGNHTEALEVVANNGGLTGPLVMRNNILEEQGDVTDVDFLLLLVEVDYVNEDIHIEDNDAPLAETAVRTLDGDFAKDVVIARNSLAYLTLDVQGSGDYLRAPQIVDNFLPSSGQVTYGDLTLRTRDGGTLPGAVVSGNTADVLRVTMTGPVTSNVTMAGNTVREETTIIGASSGAGRMDISGNNLEGTSWISNIGADVHFNRFQGMLTVTNGTDADATLNWWGCDEGPDTVDCASLNNQQFDFDPWLVFNAGADCTPPNATATFNVLTASDSSKPAGNTTPGWVAVTTSDGTLASNPTLMTGMGSVDAVLDGGVTMPSFTVTLDNETRMVSANCSGSIFADGFESGGTSAWD